MPRECPRQGCCNLAWIVLSNVQTPGSWVQLAATWSLPRPDSSDDFIFTQNFLQLIKVELFSGSGSDAASRSKSLVMTPGNGGAADVTISLLTNNTRGGQSEFEKHQFNLF